MDTSLFAYDLPLDRIAQTPVEPRDHAKLLVMDRETGALADHHVSDLPDLLAPNDLLVLNNSRVFKARWHGRIGNRSIEVFLLRPDGIGWLALLKPGKKCHKQDVIVFGEGVTARIDDKRSDGTVWLDFGIPTESLFDLSERFGDVPTPPYLHIPTTSERYQTIFATTTGSVAAPTAGLHFTQELFHRLAMRGIACAFVTLHVGLGTFRPIKTLSLEAHEMHEEWAHVPATTVAAINRTHGQGGRVIVIGTTTMRALETWGRIAPQTNAYSGFTRLFLTPGSRFHVADALLTNFHLPKSSLLVLVSAFAGREHVMRAYSQAITSGYRFYSFGDALLII